MLWPLALCGFKGTISEGLWTVDPSGLLCTLEVHADLMLDFSRILQGITDAAIVLRNLGQ
jgi:hypothetical protein